MWNVIEFGGLIFWALFAFFFIAQLACVHEEEIGKSFVPIVVFGIVIWLFSSAGAVILPWVHSYWAWLLLYVPVGVGWAIFKWFRFSINRARIYKQLLTQEGYTSINDVPRPELTSFFSSLQSALPTHEYLDEFGNRPENWVSMSPDVYANAIKRILLRVMGHPKDYIQKIAVWIIWWPFSMLNALMFDFLRELGKTIVRLLKSVFLQVSKAAFRTQSADFQNLNSK